MSYYKDLDVSKEASDSEIKKAYHKASLKYHPDKDKSPEANQNFQRISKAYSVLSDSNKRAYFDRTGKDPDEREERGGASQSFFFFRGGGGPGFEDAEGSVDPSDPMDIFSHFFGARRAGAQSQIDKIVECSYDDLIFGCTKTLKFRKLGKRKCSCFATRAQFACQQCERKGFIEVQEGPEITTTITIDPETPIGQMLCVNGYKFLLKPADREDFACRGNTILCSYPVDVFRALVGFTGSISYGREKIPFEVDKPICEENKNEVIQIPRKGLFGPGPSGRNRGDLLIKFDVQFPTSLTTEQKRLIGRCIQKTETN